MAAAAAPPRDALADDRKDASRKRRLARVKSDATNATSRTSNSQDDDGIQLNWQSLLADTDNESQSSTSSPKKNKAKLRKKERAAAQANDNLTNGDVPTATNGNAPVALGVPAPLTARSTRSKKSNQHTTDALSSSSSSSSSSSESEEGESATPTPYSRRNAELEAELAEKEIEVKPEEIIEGQYNALQHAILKRDDIAHMLSVLPAEAAEEAILRGYVRLAVQKDGGTCVLAEVISLDPSPKYEVLTSSGQKRILSHRLKCRRGSSERDVNISSVSNGEITKSEHEQWRRLIAKTGVDATMYTEGMLRKAGDLQRAVNFRFDEAVVSEMLKRRGDVEFNNQKEARMRFLVQCSVSQMHSTSIRECEINELEKRYKESVSNQHKQEEKSTQLQQQWFDKRPNLFSLKMINKKNVERQVRDDRHALDFTLELEKEEALNVNAKSNPFQRRACRPAVAWDISLTHEAAGAPPLLVPREEVAAPAASVNAAPVEAPVDTSTNDVLRLQRILRAHSGARHILAGISVPPPPARKEAGATRGGSSEQPAGGKAGQAAGGKAQEGKKEEVEAAGAKVETDAPLVAGKEELVEA